MPTFPYEASRKSTPEERRLCRFSGPGAYPVRLRQYLTQPEAFAEATRVGTVELSLTVTFRHCLRRFIRTFRPEKLRPDKELWLCIGRDGRFLVRCGKHGDEVRHLSETDSYIFHYLCFLQLHRFWNGMRKRSRFPASTLSLVIRDFGDRLDASVDYGTLLHRAKAVSSRVRMIE